MNLLDAPRLKLSVANGETEKLSKIFTAFITDGKVHSVHSHIDPNTGEQVETVRVHQSPDVTWGITTGCIAHLLRSSLDNLAFQLALLNTATPDKKTTFPIFLHKEAFLKRGFGLSKKGEPVGCIKDLRPEHRALIESMQPYAGSNGGVNDPLWQLHEMNNFDKHRTITFVVMASYSAVVRPVAESTFIGLHVKMKSTPLKDGAEIARFNPKVEMKANTSARVRFDQSCSAIRGTDVIEVLKKISKRVEGIFDLFSPLV